MVWSSSHFSNTHTHVGTGAMLRFIPVALIFFSPLRHVTTRTAVKHLQQCTLHLRTGGSAQPSSISFPSCLSSLHLIATCHTFVSSNQLPAAKFKSAPPFLSLSLSLSLCHLALTRTMCLICTAAQPTSTPSPSNQNAEMKPGRWHLLPHYCGWRIEALALHPTLRLVALMLPNQWTDSIFCFSKLHVQYAHQRYDDTSVMLCW